MVIAITHLSIENNYVDNRDASGANGRWVSSEIYYEGYLGNIKTRGTFITTEQSIKKIEEKILTDLSRYSK